VIDNAAWNNSWLSIAVVGCGLTGVGAGEEQARKVVASELSMCGEDK
jgi:NADH dehydrogenase FAD-containing subunit